MNSCPNNVISSIMNTRLHLIFNNVCHVSSFWCQAICIMNMVCRLISYFKCHLLENEFPSSREASVWFSMQMHTLYIKYIVSCLHIRYTTYITIGSNICKHVLYNHRFINNSSYFNSIKYSILINIQYTIYNKYMMYIQLICIQYLSYTRSLNNTTFSYKKNLYRCI